MCVEELATRLCKHSLLGTGCALSNAPFSASSSVLFFPGESGVASRNILPMLAFLSGLPPSATVGLAVGAGNLADKSKEVDEKAGDRGDIARFASMTPRGRLLVGVAALILDLEVGE